MCFQTSRLHQVPSQWINTHIKEHHHKILEYLGQDSILQVSWRRNEGLQET